jgi:hypothetical protein
MAESSAIAAAEAHELETVWRRAGGLTFAAKTWVISIRPGLGDAQSLLSQWRQAPYPILALEAEGRVRLDLRSVFPRWDQQLVAAASPSATNSPN